jgi:hypothetical protein
MCEDPTDGALIISGILSLLTAFPLCLASAWVALGGPGLEAWALMVTVFKFFAVCRAVVLRNRHHL